MTDVALLYDVEAWTQRIANAWERSAKAIIETGAIAEEWWGMGEGGERGRGGGGCGGGGVWCVVVGGLEVGWSKPAASLPHGDWMQLLGNIHFDHTKAKRLMEIGRDQRLGKTK